MDVEIIADGLGVCIDCAMMSANGELGQGDLAADREHARVMSEWVTRNYGESASLVLSGREGDEPWFSSTPCHGCGSLLAGDREHAAVLSH